jgi:NAD(P)-dependent dehydrogenase (short-subunit alcohol dehydrogenase family)
MKTLIITGVSRGIGKATAEKFLDEGWHVIGISTLGNSSIQSNDLEVYKTDLSNPGSIKNFVDIIEESKVKVDVLINNAAISIDSHRAIDIELLRKTLEVNLIGLVDLTERLLPMVNSDGHIINLSSGLGSLADATNSYAPAYRISKVAVNMYTRTLASRLSDRDIIVSSVDPGWVKTDMGGAGAQRNPVQPAKEIFDLATSRVDTGYFWYQGRKKAW